MSSARFEQPSFFRRRIIILYIISGIAAGAVFMALNIYRTGHDDAAIRQANASNIRFAEQATRAVDTMLAHDPLTTQDGVTTQTLITRFDALERKNQERKPTMRIDLPDYAALFDDIVTYGDASASDYKTALTREALLHRTATLRDEMYASVDARVDDAALESVYGVGLISVLALALINLIYMNHYPKRGRPE